MLIISTGVLVVIYHQVLADIFVKHTLVPCFYFVYPYQHGCYYYYGSQYHQYCKYLPIIVICLDMTGGFGAVPHSPEDAHQVEPIPRACECQC